MRRFSPFLFIAFIIILFFGCTKQFFKSSHLPSTKLVSLYSSKSMILVSDSYSEILQGDDLPKKSLQNGIEQSLIYLSRINKDKIFLFGNLEYSAGEMILSLKLFQQLLERNTSYEQFVLELEKKFYIFKSVANEDNKVLFTGYYEPTFPGSLIRSKEYNVPVYALPDDLKVLRLGKFRSSLKGRTIVYRQEEKQILPYFSRREIMAEKKLAGRKLEIAWMRDAVDLFFLQVQGSGILVLPSGNKVKLSYAGANGHNYNSIGKLLVDQEKLLLEETSMGSIRRYISKNLDEKDEILFHNSSYTFFELHVDPDGPKGNINVSLTPNRSIATDTSVFPKAGLAYIISELPEFDEEWKAKALKPCHRFVMNQDTGGAIRGAGRVDLFWGNGKRAEESAGRMRSFGKLFFVIAKKSVLSDASLNSL